MSCIVDICALVPGFLLASRLSASEPGWLALVGVLMPVYLGTALNSGAYHIDSICRASVGITSALKAWLFTAGLLLLIAYFLRTEMYLPRSLLAASFAVSVLGLIVGRQALALLIERRWPGRLTAEIMLCDRVTAQAPPNMSVLIAEQLSIRPDLHDPAMLDRFAALMRGVDRVIVACPNEVRRDWAMLLKGANIVGEVLVDPSEEIGAIGLKRVDERTTMLVSVGPLNLPQRLAKRTFDLLLCISALIALAPVLLLIAMAIKLDSDGPVFFRQRRVGRANAFFWILKFRSMHTDRLDANGNVSTRRGDSRVTRVGWVLRRTSLDELPQLLNVLGGSMSLVGPRPHALGSLAGEDLFWEVDERYWHRHALKPGITGLAQVRGYRGATHDREDLVNRLQADLEYAADWSLWRDIVIFLSTLRVVVHHNSF